MAVSILFLVTSLLIVTVAIILSAPVIGVFAVVVAICGNSLSTLSLRED